MKKTFSYFVGTGFFTVLGIYSLFAWEVPDPEQDGEDVIVANGHIEIESGSVFVDGPYNSVNNPSTAGADSRGISVGSGNTIRGEADFGGTIFETAALALVVGSDNDAGAFGCVIGGEQNKVGGRIGSAFGTYNSVNESRSYWDWAHYGDSLAAGGGNTIHDGDDCIALGANNVIQQNPALGTYWTYSKGCMALGISNTIDSSFGYAIGAANLITGEYSSALGFLLEANSSRATYVGMFNDPNHPQTPTPWKHTSDPLPEEDPVFVVGNGKSDTERSNALVVLRNGDVIITKPQGDVSMGIFGSGN